MWLAEWLCGLTAVELKTLADALPQHVQCGIGLRRIFVKRFMEISWELNGSSLGILWSSRLMAGSSWRVKPTKREIEPT